METLVEMMTMLISFISFGLFYLGRDTSILTLVLSIPFHFILILLIIVLVKSKISKAKARNPS